MLVTQTLRSDPETLVPGLDIMLHAHGIEAVRHSDFAVLIILPAAELPDMQSAGCGAPDSQHGTGQQLQQDVPPALCAG